MENLPTQLLKKSNVDFNQVLLTILEHFTNAISEKVISEVELLLSEHLTKQETKTIFLNQRQACERLGITRSTLYQREKAGHIKRDGSNGRPLYSEEQIEAYLNKSSRPERLECNDDHHTSK